MFSFPVVALFALYIAILILCVSKARAESAADTLSFVCVHGKMLEVTR